MAVDQRLMGIAVAAMCLWGLAQHRWFLANTRKGQALARRFGEANGLWVLRGLFFAGAVFGALLAVDVIRPVKW